MKNRTLYYFLGFSAVFAIAIVYVFWGTWSLDFVPVMPDDSTFHAGSYGDWFAGWWRKVTSTGKILPTDLLWNGLLFSPYFCQELKYASAVFFAGLGLAFYLRGRGLDHFACGSAGLLLAFSGYWLTLFSAGHGGWFVWMTYGVFAFGLADRAVRRNRLRNWILLPLVVAWAGYQQQDLWLLFTIFTAAYFVWCCIRERKLPWKGALLALGVFAVAYIPGFIDSLNVVRNREAQIEESKGTSLTGGKTNKASDDKEARWIFVTNWSLPADEIAEFAIPRLNGDTSCPLVLSIGSRYRSGVKPYTGAIGRPTNAKAGNYRQHSVYVGWVTLILALFGVVFSWRLDRDVRFFAIAGLITCLLSLGRYCEPLYRVIFALPVGDLIRCPVKWHHLTELSLCALAGFGLASIRAKLLKIRFLVPAILVLIGVADLAYHASFYCAPIDVTRARQLKAGGQLTVLSRQDFANPQVQELQKRGFIVPVANYLGNPDAFLVEILKK